MKFTHAVQEMSSYHPACAVKLGKIIFANGGRSKFGIFNMESERVNFDGLLLMTGDTHDDENLIGYRVFAPLFNDISYFIEICLNFE